MHLVAFFRYTNVSCNCKLCFCNVKPCSMIVSLLWPTQGQTCADYPGITKLLMEVPGLRCSVKFNSFHSNITVSLAKAGPLGPRRIFSTFKIDHPF